MIHIIDRQTERILDVLVNQSDSKIYWDTKMTEAIEDNVLIFEFRMLADSPAAKHLIPKNKLTAQDQDGFHRLFIIDSVEMSHDANGKILFVSALGDHIELANDEPIPPQTLAGQTAETAVQFVLANTRYVPGQIDFAGSRTITFDTYTNPLAALQKIASEFELELRFRVTVNPDGTITRIVDLLKPDDLFDGKEIVFGKDMTGIRRKENTENICTRLVGIGPADENGNLVTIASVNGGKIYVEDEEAYQRWNNAGRHIWGIFEYQPEGDTEVTPQQLLNATKKEMEKRKNSVVEWEVQAAALEQVIGLEHERVRVGMNVRIKDEAFDPPIYLEARVLETKMPELDDPNGNFSYTFGNYRQVTVVVPPEVKAIQKTLYRNANSWTAAKTIAEKKAQTFEGQTPPTQMNVGDLWYNPASGAFFRWDGSAWILVADETGKNTAADTAKVGGKPAVQVIADITAAQQAAEETRQQIQDVQQGLSDLDQYVDGAFKDGLVQESEAKAIEKYLNQLNTEKQDIDARYNSIYNDTNLTGTAKTNLANAKSSYNTAHTNLVNSINSAIADGKVTSTEKADVDAKFSAYRSALATLSQRFEEAIRAIEQAKATQAENNAKTYTDQNAVKKGALYNGVSITSEDGFKVVRSDQLVQGVFNATEGIRFQTRPNTASAWQDAFFFDVNTKKFKFAGHLEGASGTFTGTISGGTIEGTTITGSTFYSSGFDEYGNLNELILDSGYISYHSGGAAGGDATEINIGESGITMDYYSGGGYRLYHGEFTIDGLLMRDELFSKWFSVDFFFGVAINDLNVEISSGSLNISNSSKQLVLTESDIGNKQWHIEVNNGALNLVETNIATRLTLYPGGGLETRDDIIFSVGLGRVVADSSATYIQNNTEIRATKYKSTTYVPVRASSFPTGSLAEYKEDIHPWQESALEKIRNTTIYEYYLKSELEQGIQRKRQGLVIGEGYNTPDGVVDGDGVEQYLLNAWSWKAIQELDSMQMNHEDRIAQLEQKIAELEAKIG